MNNKVRSFGASLPGLAVGVTLLVSGQRAVADGDVIPHALARYEHSSNMLLVPDSSIQTDAKGTPRKEDDFFEYNAGIDLNYRLRDNRFFVITNFNHFAYNHFSQLDHDGFAGSGGVDWVATRKIKGNLSYEYDRHQLSFANIVNVDPGKSYIETTQAFRFTGNYEMNSHWSTNLGGSYSEAKMPGGGTTGTVSYDASQSQWRAGVTYTGSAKLKTGFAIDRVTGQYRDKQQPGYTRTLFEYTADYKLGARSNFGGSLGYARRVQAMNNDATVGSLYFNQQVTAKTSYFLQFRRTQDTYNTTIGSQLSTSGVAGLTWQVTPKISLSGDYDYTKAKVDGSTGTTTFTRDDTIRSANASMKYMVLRWLSLSPYYRYQHRESSDPNFSFNASIYGINLDVRFNP